MVLHLGALRTSHARTPTVREMGSVSTAMRTALAFIAAVPLGKHRADLPQTTACKLSPAVGLSVFVYRGTMRNHF
eukprot:5442701-Pyramimonas_sp.AAC.1